MIAVRVIAELFDDLVDVFLGLVGKRDKGTGRRAVGGER